MTNAVHCEAIKYSYRQSKDGMVISFVLHPQEVPSALATAAIGTRYMLAVAEIGDDEQPKKEVEPDTRPRSTAAQSGGANKRRFEDMPASQQAGLLCTEMAFWRFLTEEHSYDVNNDVDAAEAVRELCGVASRSELDIAGAPPLRWTRVRDSYRGWYRAPEVVG